MKNPFPPSVRVGLCAAIALFATASTQAAAPVALQFTSTSTNTTGNILTLNDPRLNGKGSLKLIVSQDVLSSAIAFNNHPIGIVYDQTAKQWKIFNEDVVAIPTGAIFNVLIPETAQRVNGGATNSFYNQTFFNVRMGEPNALLLQTHIFDPFPNITSGAFNGVFQLNPVGLYYYPVITTHPVPASSAHWELFNENAAPALAAAYNVADVTGYKVAGVPHSFIFTTSTVSGDFAPISNPLTNDTPNVILFANQVSLAPGVVYNHFYAVAYDVSTSAWGIVSEDGSSMPVGISFVVAVVPPSS